MRLQIYKLKKKTFTLNHIRVYDPYKLDCDLQFNFRIKDRGLEAIVDRTNVEMQVRTWVVN